MTLRESLIASGALTPADRVEPKPYASVDLGVPLLRLIGTEARMTKHKNWMPPFIEPPFTEEGLKL